MILFVSGRTDIPAFYGEWFSARYKEGLVDTRNPFYPKLISRIYFEDVDLLFFCSKNPTPFLPRLREFDKPILFHITVTPYREDIESNMPDKREVLSSIKEISRLIGPKNTVVRYDPIFLSKTYDVAYHLRAFEKLTKDLQGFVQTIIVSFLDDCKSVRRNAGILQVRPFEEEDYRLIGQGFSRLAEEAGIVVQTCYEERNPFEYGFYPGECLSPAFAFELTGRHYKPQTARKGGGCRCVRMCDIGDYNCCPHGCKYCYANYSPEDIIKNMARHDPTSSLLLGRVQEDDIIKRRRE